MLAQLQRRFWKTGMLTQGTQVAIWGRLHAILLSLQRKQRSTVVEHSIICCCMCNSRQGTRHRYSSENATLMYMRQANAIWLRLLWCMSHSARINAAITKTKQTKKICLRHQNKNFIARHSQKHSERCSRAARLLKQFSMNVSSLSLKNEHRNSCATCTACTITALRQHLR